MVAALVGGACAGVRLLPWIAADDVPWAVSIVFLEALLLAAVEVGLALALPLGVALEAERWGHDGTVVALRTLGVGPLRLAANALAVSVMVGVLVVAISFRSTTMAASPGELSNDLLAAAGDEACASGRPVRVPLVQAAWLCMDGKPWLVGWFPAHGQPTLVWKASHARFGSNLDRVEFKDTTLVAGSASSVRANDVVMTGFLPWLVPTTVPPPLRASATGAAACGAALAATWSLVRWPLASKVRAVLVGTGGMLLFLFVGALVLRSMGWLGLVLLLVGVVGCPVLLAWLTRFHRLPGSTSNGTRWTAWRRRFDR